MGIPDYEDTLNHAIKLQVNDGMSDLVREVYKRALDRQVAGNHYKKFPIQPAEFCHKNGIPYLEATAIKYLCRWRDKGGVQDLDKAIHFIELLKEFENVDS